MDPTELGAYSIQFFSFYKWRGRERDGVERRRGGGEGRGRERETEQTSSLNLGQFKNPNSQCYAQEIDILKDPLPKVSLWTAVKETL